MTYSCKTTTCSGVNPDPCNAALCAAKASYAAGSSCETSECTNKECFKMRKYECGVAQAKGALIYNGNLYVNLVDANLDDPALGAGRTPATYAGAFDLESLIQYLIANPTTPAATDP